MLPSLLRPIRLYACFWPVRDKGKKGDLSRFIEDAVQAHILELTAVQAKTANAHLDEAEITSMVDEALDWARHR